MNTFFLKTNNGFVFIDSKPNIGLIKAGWIELTPHVEEHILEDYRFFRLNELRLAGRQHVLEHFKLNDWQQQYEDGIEAEVSEWANTDKPFNKKYDSFKKSIEKASSISNLRKINLQF